MKNRTLGDLGGQRLGQLNYSPSCFDVHLPWDMAANRAVLAMTMPLGAQLVRHLERAVLLEAMLLGGGWGPH